MEMDKLRFEIDAVTKAENARLQQERLDSENQKEGARLAVKVAELDTKEKESAARLALDIAEKVDLDG